MKHDCFIVSDKDLDLDEPSDPSDLSTEKTFSTAVPSAKKKLKSYDAKVKLSVIAFAQQQ